MLKPWLRRVGAVTILAIGMIPIAAGDATLQPVKTKLVPQGLVGWWHFDDCLANDGGPYRRTTHVTFSNEEVGCDKGVSGKAYRFRGVTAPDHIEVKNDPPMVLSKGFSLSLWFQLSSNIAQDGDGGQAVYGTQVLVSKSDDRTGLSLRMERSRRSSLWHIYASNGRCCKSTPKAYPALEEPAMGVKVGDWHMVTLTYHPKKDELRLFLDGRLRSEVKGSDFDLNPQTDLENLNIGAEKRGAWYPFAGLIDEVRVYNRPILPIEVLQLFGQRPRK